MTANAPNARRVKTYTAQTGYVYQYYFVGKRPASDAETMEYIFDVSNDRKTLFAVTVSVLREALDAWAAEHGRALSDTEQYAAAKLRLMKGFDEIPAMKTDGLALVVDANVIEEVLEPLELE